MWKDNWHGWSLVIIQHIDKDYICILHIHPFIIQQEVCFYFLYLISKSQSNMLWVKSSLNFAIKMLLFAKTFQNICSALYSFDEQFSDIYWWWLNISHCAWGRHDYVGAELCTFNYCYVILVKYKEKIININIYLF